jgi:hypothetical protein
MSGTKYLKGECTHCGGHLEFPAEAAGMTTECPHCGKQTELLLAAPKDESGIPARMIIWTIVAVLVLGGGLGAAMYALKRAQRWAEGRKQVNTPIQNTNVVATNAAPVPPTPDPIAEAGFRVSEIKLEKAPGTSLVHALGTVENLSAKTRYGVTVQLELLNAEGKKIGTTTDYQNAMEPGAKWTFQAPVVNSKAASGKVTGVLEQK